MASRYVEMCCCCRCCLFASCKCLGNFRRYYYSVGESECLLFTTSCHRILLPRTNTGITAETDVHVLCSWASPARVLHVNPTRMCKLCIHIKWCIHQHSIVSLCSLNLVCIIFITSNTLGAYLEQPQNCLSHRAAIRVERSAFHSSAFSCAATLLSDLFKATKVSTVISVNS